MKPRRCSSILGLWAALCVLQASADELADLHDRRIKTLQQAVELIEAQYRAGVANIQELMDSQARFLEAKLDAASNQNQRIEVLKQLLELSAATEQAVEARFQAGGAKRSDLLLAKAARLRVEIQLLKEKQRSENNLRSSVPAVPAYEDRVNIDADTSSPKGLLVGDWAGTVDGDNRLFVTFHSNGTFDLVNVDPANKQRVKVRVRGTYKADFSVSPAHLDFDASIYKPKRKEPVKHKFETIIEMVDTDELRMSDLELTSRPKTFGKRSVIMDRQDVAHE